MIRRVQKKLSSRHILFTGIPIIFIKLLKAFYGEFDEKMAIVGQNEERLEFFITGKVFRVEPKGIFVNKLH